MKLTTVERLTLSNQYKILEKLYPEEANSYSKLREAIEHGYTKHYFDQLEWFYDEMNEGACEEVISILQMYRSLFTSYKSLTDKTGINEDDVRYQGFDGNNETDQLTYAQYFMYKLGRYKEFHHETGEVEHNSHMPMLPGYRKMLIEYHKCERYGKLTNEEIRRIIKAV